MRVMLSLIFLVAAVNHLIEPGKVAGRLQKSQFSSLVTGFAEPQLLVTLAGAGLLIGGILLLIGYKTKLAALLLILILVPITITVQLDNPEGAGPLFKNIAMLGGLIFFTINGSVYYALDELTDNYKKTNTI